MCKEPKPFVSEEGLSGDDDVGGDNGKKWLGALVALVLLLAIGMLIF